MFERYGSRLHRCCASRVGLSVRQVEIGSRQLFGFGIIEHESAEEILFDPETGCAVGLRSLRPGRDGEDPLIQPPDGMTTLGPGVSILTLWTQAVVDEVGQTG